VQNQLDVPFGASVGVLGCGGLGLFVIAALRARGAGLIFGIDINVNKRQLTLDAGASEMLAALDKPVDIIIDTTGVEALVASSLGMLNPGGQLALLVNNSRLYNLPSARLFAGDGMRVIPTQGGASLPDVDIPRIGSFLKDRESIWRGIVTHSFPLSQINEAIEVLKSGVAGRIMIDVTGD
jgi:S-(hydroxymethyl)glutathione dehydrogenase/alcohol dehydrogenase